MKKYTNKYKILAKRTEQLVNIKETRERLRLIDEFRVFVLALGLICRLVVKLSSLFLKIFIRRDRPWVSRRTVMMITNYCMFVPTLG